MSYQGCVAWWWWTAAAGGSTSYLVLIIVVVVAITLTIIADNVDTTIGAVPSTARIVGAVYFSRSLRFHK
jgi:uncharacterized membrane protein YedE/YeeE